MGSMMGAHPNFCGRKTTYWILSPPSSSTCQWGSPFFSIQPYFHCPAVWSTDIVRLHSTVYYIPSSTLTLSFYKISHRETFVNSLTVYWHHLRKIYAFYVQKKKKKKKKKSTCVDTLL